MQHRSARIYEVRQDENEDEILKLKGIEKEGKPTYEMFISVLIT